MQGNLVCTGEINPTTAVNGERSVTRRLQLKGFDNMVDHCTADVSFLTRIMKTSLPVAHKGESAATNAANSNATIRPETMDGHAAASSKVQLILVHCNTADRRPFDLPYESG